MFGINTNYQISFTGKYIPISEYKGKPRLTPAAIELTNKLKDSLKNIDKIILDTEDQIAEAVENRHDTRYLRGKLDFFNDRKILCTDLIRQIHEYKRGALKRSTNFLEEPINRRLETIAKIFDEPAAY